MPTVTVFPSTVVDAGGGGIAWANPSNAKTSNNAYATVTGLDNGGDPNYSNLLRLTGFDFSAVPTFATITGIEINVEYYTNVTGFNTRPDWREVKLFYSGAAQGSELSGGASTQDTDADVTDTFGGSDEPLGIDGSHLRLADFGVQLSLTATSNPTDVGIDAVSITVHYSETPMSTITEVKNADNVQLGLGVLGLVAYPAGSPQTFLDVGYIKSCTVSYTRELKDFESAGILVKRLVFRDRLTLTADWAEISATNMKKLIANGATGTEGESQYGVRFGGSRAIKRYVVRFESTRDDNGLITVDIYKATPAGEFRLAFAEEEFITYPTEFSAEVDTGKPVGQRYGKITVVPGP